MKIALVSPSVLTTPPRRYGGVEVVVSDLGKGLAKRGHSVTIIAPRGSKAPPGGSLIETIEPPERVQVNWLDLEGQAYDIYRDSLGKFDIVHDHSWFSFPYLYRAEHGRPPVIKTMHGWPTWESLPPVEHPNLCAISRFMALGVETHFQDWVRVRTLYNPVDPEKYPLYTGEREDYLLFISRISRIKAPHWAIRVAKMAGMKLVMAGGEFVEDPNYVRSIKAMCDGKDIIWKGEVSHEEKVELMQKARAVLCLSSIPNFPEPLGLIALEANLCGTPAIAINNGAWAEVIKEGYTGFVCRSLEEMAEAANRIDNCESLALRCRRWVKERFSIDIIAKEHERVYQDILDGKEW